MRSQSNFGLFLTQRSLHFLVFIGFLSFFAQVWTIQWLSDFVLVKSNTDYQQLIFWAAAFMAAR